jgi:hypothetical protein
VKYQSRILYEYWLEGDVGQKTPHYFASEVKSIGEALVQIKYIWRGAMVSIKSVKHLGEVDVVI